MGRRTRTRTGGAEFYIEELRKAGVSEVWPGTLGMLWVGRVLTGREMQMLAGMLGLRFRRDPRPHDPEFGCIEITAQRERTPASPGNSPTAAPAPGGAGESLGGGGA